LEAILTLAAVCCLGWPAQASEVLFDPLPPPSALALAALVEYEAAISGAKAIAEWEAEQTRREFMMKKAGVPGTHTKPGPDAARRDPTEEGRQDFIRTTTLKNQLTAATSARRNPAPDH